MYWLWRLGTPGSTARWAANAYKSCTVGTVVSGPQLNAIFHEMVRLRYKLWPNKKHEIALQAGISECECLSEFVMLILLLETPIGEVTTEYLQRGDTEKYLATNDT